VYYRAPTQEIAIFGRNAVISYEYPSERAHPYAPALEDLYSKMPIFQWRRPQDPTRRRTLFEVLEVAGRADLKVDLVQELERTAPVSSRSATTEISDTRSGALYEIEQASSSLLAWRKIGQYMRENEWLMAIRSRASIPGGVCQFDLPSYHFWLNREPDQRRVDLEGWIHPMMPIREGLAIVLRLLRASGRPEMQVARGGTFQLTMSGRSAQMLRLRLVPAEAVVPEISANKYALNVRFMLAETVIRPRQVERDVPFEITFCSL